MEPNQDGTVVSSRSFTADSTGASASRNTVTRRHDANAHILYFHVIPPQETNDNITQYSSTMHLGSLSPFRHLQHSLEMTARGYDDLWRELIGKSGTRASRDSIWPPSATSIAKPVFDAFKITQKRDNPDPYDVFKAIQCENLTTVERLKEMQTLVATRQKDHGNGLLVVPDNSSLSDTIKAAVKTVTNIFSGSEAGASENVLSECKCYIPPSADPIVTEDRLRKMAEFCEQLSRMGTDRNTLRKMVWHEDPGSSSAGQTQSEEDQETAGTALGIGVYFVDNDTCRELTLLRTISELLETVGNLPAIVNEDVSVI